MQVNAGELGVDADQTRHSSRAGIQALLPSCYRLLSFMPYPVVFEQLSS